MTSRASWLSTAAFALLSIVLVGSLWTIPYLPTNDGPESILAVHMENHFGDPGVIYPQVFAPAPQFAGRGFTVLYEPLEEWLGWQRGLQVALSVIVLLDAWSIVWLIRAIDPRRLPLGYLAFPLALSWCFYMGFFAFSLALGVGVGVLALALRSREPSPFERVLVALLLLLVAFLHMFAAILAGVVLVVASTARATPGQRIRELARVAVTGVPAAALVITAVLVAKAGAVQTPFAGEFLFLPFRQAVASWPRTLAPGPLGRALVVTAALALVAAVAGRRTVSRNVLPRDRALGALALAFLAASLFCPRDVPGWQCFAERFVWIGVVTLLVTLPFERLPSRATEPLVLVASLAWLAMSYPFHRKLAGESADAIAGLFARVERHGVWLPVSLTPLPPSEHADIPFQSPLHHIGALYATAHGGLTPYTFASNPASWPFKLRPDALRPPPVPRALDMGILLNTPALATNAPFRHKQENVLATFGMFYEGVLVTGAQPDDLVVWRRRGFVADWEQGSAMMAHFEPCPLDVVVPRTPTAPLLDVGVGATMTLRDAALPLFASEDGSVHLHVDHGPCGKVWARPHWDASTPGVAPRIVCENSGDEGELEGIATHEGGRIVCSGVKP